MKLPCDISLDRLEAYADGELDAHEAQTVESHLSACNACRTVVNAHRALRAAVGEVFEELTPSFEKPDEWQAIAAQLQYQPSLWQRVRERFGSPMIWLPSAAAATAVAAIIFFTIRADHPLPTVLQVSKVESVSVSSPAEQVWIFQTAQSGQTGKFAQIR